MGGARMRKIMKLKGRKGCASPLWKSENVYSVLISVLAIFKGHVVTIGSHELECGLAGHFQWWIGGPSGAVQRTQSCWDQFPFQHLGISNFMRQILTGSHYNRVGHVRPSPSQCFLLVGYGHVTSKFCQIHTSAQVRVGSWWREQALFVFCPDETDGKGGNHILFLKAVRALQGTLVQCLTVVPPAGSMPSGWQWWFPDLGYSFWLIGL